MKAIWIILFVSTGSVMAFFLINPLQIETIEDIKAFIFSGNILPSLNQPDNRTIGYVLLDNNSVLHIWNEIDDYYFDVDSGIQLTNHYDEYWSHNVFCGGLKYLGEWEYNCNDELPFNWNISTDNSTYINITGYRDVSKIVGGNEYKVRFALRYNLENNDTYLTIQPYVKNIGTRDIPLDLGFAWRIKDIKIGNTYENDSIYINDTKYWLNQTPLDLNFTNLNESEVFIVDEGGEWIWLGWNNDLNYLYNIRNQTGEYNAPNTLLINAGSLNINQEKSTSFFWIDALCDWSCNYLYPETNPYNISQGESYFHNTSIIYSGRCIEQGTMTAKFNGITINSTTNLSTQNINPLGTFDLVCSGGSCVGEWTITGEEVGSYDVQDTCTFNGVGTQTTATKTINVLPVSEGGDCGDYVQVGSNMALSGNNASCFNITANNVLFDCNNYQLTGININNFTIMSKNTNNITIKDCFFSGVRRAILLDYVSNSTLYNNTFYNISDKSPQDVNAVAIYLNYTDNTNITKNNITNVIANSSSITNCYTGYSYGIYLSNSPNNNISNSIIDNVSGNSQGLSGEGCDSGQRPVLGENVYIVSSSNAFIDKSSIKNGRYGIRGSTSDYLNIISNNFTNFYLSAVYTISSDYALINNNTIQNGTYSIYLTSSSDYPNIYNNLVSYGNVAVYIDGIGGNISNNTLRHASSTDTGVGSLSIQAISTGEVKNNTIYNDSHNGNSSAGVYVTRQVTMEDLNVTSAYRGISFGGTADNSKVYNSTLYNITNWSAYLSSGATNISFYNVSFNKSNTKIESSATFFNYYWLWINVTNQDLIPISSALINATDTYGTLVQDTTGANGLTSMRAYLEFNETSSERINVTPYNITAYKTGYTTNSTLNIMNQSTIVHLILESLTCWTYNDITKFLTIPTGCLYPCEGILCVI